MKKLRTGIAFLLLAALGCSLFIGCAPMQLETPPRNESVDLSYGFSPAESKNKFQRVNENDRFVLSVNFKNGEAAIEDKLEGKTWYTNPADKSEDGLASGFNKNALQSIITVVYTTNLSVDMTCGGFMSSVRKDGLSYRIEPDGSAILMFDFPNEEFSVPVRYSIDEFGFNAEILSNGIREYGTNTVKSVDLLPFFGAGGTKDEGYMLVPDGSGALIRYNNRRKSSTFSKPLYGLDAGTSDKLSGAVTIGSLSESQYLPVFGVQQNDHGFLAIITEGSARAAVNANVSYKYTLYNTVWPTYNYRSVGTVWQSQKDGSQKVTNVQEKTVEDWQNFTVSYRFLREGQSTYADMAAVYREYLIETEGLCKRTGEQGEIPLYLDLYGYIKKTKSLLGIPLQKKIAVTTTEDVQAMLDTLEAAGISNVVVKYNYWSKNSYFDKLPTGAKVDSCVGTASEMRQLQQRLRESGGGLYLSADILNVYKTGNGVSQYGGVLRSVANTNQRQIQFSLRNTSVDTRYTPWYLLAPRAIPVKLEKLSENLTGAGYDNMSLDAFGEMLYSELGTDGIGRSHVLETLRAAAAKAGTEHDLMLTSANAYAAAAAAHIVCAPSRASGYDLEDAGVPFYQMVFHGYTSYSLDAVNLASNLADTTLRYLEYGASPMYSLIGRNADELIGSRMNGLYSADAANWIDFLIRQYNRINEVLGRVQGCIITEHRVVSNDVRAVTYENGITIYINYGARAASADGIVLQAKGYAVAENGSVLLSGQAEGR